MWGAVLALAADAVVRAPWGGVPLNAVLSLMGAPMVLHVLMKKTWSA
jgi:ABC-type Fe3+-siderophore transport system permease subunit